MNTSRHAHTVPFIPSVGGADHSADDCPLVPPFAPAEAACDVIPDELNVDEEVSGMPFLPAEAACDVTPDDLVLVTRR